MGAYRRQLSKAPYQIHGFVEELLAASLSPPDPDRLHKVTRKGCATAFPPVVVPASGHTYLRQVSEGMAGTLSQAFRAYRQARGGIAVDITTRSRANIDRKSAQRHRAPGRAHPNAMQERGAWQSAADRDGGPRVREGDWLAGDEGT